MNKTYIIKSINNFNMKEVIMMPFEIGGRADKGGNRYEVKVAIYYILQLLDEQIEHVVIEAIGQDEEGTDIWIKKLDGTRVSLQNKANKNNLEY